MAVRVSGLESRCVSGAQQFLTVVGNKDDFTGKYVYELIGCGVPMALAGPSARRQFEQIDAELRETGSVSELLPLARSARQIKRRRIKRPNNRCN